MSLAAKAVRRQQEQRAQAADQAAEESMPSAANGSRAKIREGQKHIGGWFSMSYYQALLTIRAAHPDKTIQSLVKEALDDLLEKYKPALMR